MAYFLEMLCSSLAFGGSVLCLSETCLCPWPASCVFRRSCIISQFLLRERLNSTLGPTSTESSHGTEAWMPCYFLCNTIKHPLNCSNLRFDRLITVLFIYLFFMLGKCFLFRIHNSLKVSEYKRISTCLFPYSDTGWN